MKIYLLAIWMFHIYYNIIQDSQDMETTKMSIDGQMDKENMVYERET